LKTVFRKSFERDLKRIKNRSILRQIKRVIEEVEAATSLQAVGNVKKLRGASGFYRIRIAEYRIGIAVETAEVEFVRCLHRRDIYRFSLDSVHFAGRAFRVVAPSHRSISTLTTGQEVRAGVSGNL